MNYDNKLTKTINCYFQLVAIETRVSGENKKGNLLQDCLFGYNVGMITGSSDFLEDIAHLINSSC